MISQEIINSPNDWCWYSFSWSALWASFPLTLWCRACWKPYFCCDLPWNCRWYWCFKVGYYLSLNKEYLQAISKFSLLSCKKFLWFWTSIQCDSNVLWSRFTNLWYITHKLDLIVVLTHIIISLSSMYFIFGNLFFSVLYVVCSYVCLSVCFL